MQRSHPAILVEHEHERAIVSFVAPVTESSVIELVRTVNELQRQRFYRHVELQIASPGGQVLALQYFLEALAYWKDRGHRLTTLALTSCASAAAVMLSLGDRRKASPTSLILYHFARIHVSEATPITRTHARHFAESLELLDARILGALVSRAASNPPPVDEFSAEDRNALQELRTALGDRSDGKDSAAWLAQWLKATQEASAQDREARWTTLYRILCETDRPISGRLAYSLGLVDELVQPMAADSAVAPVPRRSLRVPEWTNAYRDGAVDVAYLKRHTLVLGETGSGKTVSAVLPVLAAAYRAPEVGVVLVIDPKDELGRVLQDLEAAARSGDAAPKRIQPIEPDQLKIDLMSTQAWAIDDFLRERRYWSAAERMLQRVAGLSTTSGARILLGHPPTGNEPYWDREGVRFASAVIARAIAWIVDGDAFARLTRDRLSNACDDRWRSWDAIRQCFQKVYPHAFALDPKWEDWLKRVRADYRDRYAERIDEDFDAPDTEDGEDNLWYATHLSELIDGTLERGRYEEDALGRLSAMAKSHNERQVIGAISREYEERVRNQCEAYEKERERFFEALPVEKVMDGMVQLVRERLPQGVAGRSKDAWRALLGEALDQKVEENREWARRWKERADQTPAPEDGGDADDHMRQTAEDEIDIALERLIVENLREAGGEDWESLCEDARRQETEVQLSTDSEPRTVFLNVLDEFEHRCLTMGSTESDTANVMAVASVILQALFSASDGEQVVENAQGERRTIPTAAESLADEWSERGGELGKTGATLGEFARMRASAPQQYTGVMGHAASIIEEFARPGVERVLYFGCERAVRQAREGLREESRDQAHGEPKPGEFLDFRDSVSRRPETGTVYVYQPSRHKHDELIAKACKSLFFEAVLDSDARKGEPDPPMPLAGYIADEFQRFVTADMVHGEQSFLDVCRSFGAFAVLACQSIASLRYALCDLERDRDKRDSAIDIIFNNTATKMFFRSTDEETVRRVRTVSPRMSDGHSVIDIRPLSTLKAGECYASFPDGRFERVQIEEYAAAGQERQPALRDTVNA